MMHFKKVKISTYIILVLLIVGLLCTIVGFIYEGQEEKKPHYVTVSTLIEQLDKEERDELKRQEELQQDLLKQPLAKDVTMSDQATNTMEEQPVVNSEPEQDVKININTATIEELQQLKGIGPSKARAIIEERERGGPFIAIDDIKRVKGIGDKIFQKIKDSLVN